MTDQEFVEWRNEGERTNYPFTDTATLKSTSGQVIDQDAFYDARLYPVGSSADLYLSSIIVTEAIMTITVGNSINASLATGTYDATSGADSVFLNDQYGRPAGVLVSSAAKLQALAGQMGQGTNKFTAAATPFVPSLIIPQPQLGLQGILLDDGTLLAGDVWLIGTDGIVLSLDRGAIRVDVVGDPYALVKACNVEGIVLEPFCGLRTINGIPPDANGDFKLSAGSNLAATSVLRVNTQPASVTVNTVGAKGKGSPA